MINVQGLIKDYGPTRAVAGVSFTVNPGEVVGLLGPNGAGKSTTLRVLTGYLPPTAGTVTLDGVNVLADALETRRRVGYLSETNPLYESLGVWEALELFAHLREIPPGRIDARLREVIDQCALRDVVSKDIGELSKGYRQRLGLALAILADPPILILDEPTSALDPNQQKDVRDLILRLKEKKTVLLSTHILPEAQRMCDRLLIIHKGQIVAQGTVAELQDRLAGAQSFYVRLKAPAAAAEALAGLAGVTAVEKRDEAEVGCPGFLLTGTRDPREDLARLCADRRWPLMELRRQTATLDDIFRQLTVTP
ncbi:MAG: ABC transporter ATP-binding protein [Elusimicrobia bacterium]|nr:ABC transporter ATP-binding protein [Elusimicrobiota bacterium]MBK7207718.1 ABC transporter ATP-binding protein [Elusimicrobiota bacterium]MBK7544479.1 ABC transporter ATP-binding protein [Elusimicrobiota bacterium]MBK7574002.1 ABC transporter ATP-binding protein [Elusimicrobiota bacterium]MBK7689049.1 ABC transporter ATP-binding protein [Elusimicrobiota bacterium]